MKDKYHLISSKINKPIVIVGFMGVGKTSLGKIIAKKLSLQFIDSDKEIEDCSLCSVIELFSIYGEEKFREMEKNVISRLINSYDKNNNTFVLSTGEGSFLSEHTRQFLKEKAITIWIDISPALLLSRVKFKDTRPLLIDNKSEDMLIDILNSRRDVYKSCDIHIMADNETIYKTTNKVISKLYQLLK